MADTSTNLPDAMEQNAPPIVIGIGASATAPDSIERFLAGLTGDAGFAIVLVLQRREALDETRLAALLHQQGLSLVDVTDGGVITGGSVYLCPADVITGIADEHFTVRPATEEPGRRGTIDSFLISLAEARGADAIGVVLAGTGSGGTLGVAALKERGALAIAELPTESPGDRLENSKHAAAIADITLPAEDIADHVADHVRLLRRLDEDSEAIAPPEQAAAFLVRIADILQRRTGHDFHGYKQNTFLRRIQRRMLVVQAETLAAYLDYLRADRDEAQFLFNDLLIGVTQFFRDRREFEFLQSQVIPRLFENKGAGDQVRVWVLGCATGEEAYSIGIQLREHMATLAEPPQVQIFATDIDGRALASARVGRYQTRIESDVSPERLERWFVREGETYCVVKELREMCIFSQHNVIKDAPFSRLDLVSCRNLLIYLDSELQNRVIPLFHFALLPEKFLFLGNSENVTRHQKLFVPIDRQSRIFRRLETRTRVSTEFPIPAVDVDRRAQRIAERYAPAHVVVDEHLQIVHFSGRTGRYIEPAAGAASLDLLSLVNRDLRIELTSVLNRALETDQSAEAEQVPFSVNGSRYVVDIIVEPIRDRASGPRNLVVVFRDWPARPLEFGPRGTELVPSDHVEQLEGELRATRDRLQTTIEELESTNEELKSSNEEYQSLNEELQSANEELETSREELQSVNEELTTVNGELAHRVHELTRATSDLKNFLESTQIATIFLDNDLRVMNFTPSVSQLIPLTESDIGRPLSDMRSDLPVQDFYEDARRVLRTLASAEREMSAASSGTRYIVRILPYRSIDNFIAGIVVTFIDITAITRAEERQRLLLAELQHRVRNTLSVVRSIARRSAETSSTVEDYFMHLDGRLNAFARTQALLTRDPGAGVDLEYLVVEELLAFRTQEGEKLRIAGPKLRLQAKAAETFGLAVHELATNAIKYGALSQGTGHVDVTWMIREENGLPLLDFTWEERGGPGLDGGPRRRGFGTELLEKSLAFELRARTRLYFDPFGFRCEISIPITERVVVPFDTAKHNA